jgi:hypothetical protein
MFQPVRSALLALSLLVPFASGCTVVESDVVYVPQRRVVVFQDAPTLVYIGDGVYVVRDYDTAVYYVNGAYYYNDGGVWFSSPYWNSPWTTTTVGFVPVGLHHRVHHHYVHYSGGPGAQVVRAPSRDRDHHPASPTHASPSREAAAPAQNQESNHGEAQARRVPSDYRLASSEADRTRSTVSEPRTSRSAPESRAPESRASESRAPETRAPEKKSSRSSASSPSSSNRAKPAVKSSGSRSSAPRRAPSKKSRSR